MPLETVPSRGPDPFEGSRTMAFTCHECGDCCKGSAILLSPFDVARLAAFSRLTPKELIKERCVVLKHPQTELPAVMLETVPQCSFLREDLRCSVYSHRPLVCRGYPLGVLTDLNQPGWRNALQRFSIRANACPAPTNPDRGLPMVRTLHQMATGAGMEAYAEASRVWSRLTWDVSTESRYPSMSVAESLAFDREFLRLFFEEIPAPADEGQALTAFVERVRDFRARHRLLHTPVEGVSTPPGASPA